MPYTSKQVANEFLELAKNDGKQLTPMQLQKLVYFAYGWYMAITGERLLDERVEAWQWGPVIPSLYSEFRRYGSEPITAPAGEAYVENGQIVIRPHRLNSGDPARDILARQIIARVWQVYGRYSASQLSSMTHAENSPWSQVYDKDVRNTDIPDNVIKEYFERLAASQHDRQPAVTRG